MKQTLSLLYKNPGSLFPEDLEWLADELLLNHEKRITNLIYSSLAKEIGRANDTSYQLLLDALKTEIKEYIKYILNVFLFEKQHWKNNYSIDAYLEVSLKNYLKKYSENIKGIEKSSILICPLCKLDKIYEYLIKQDNLWKCARCSQISDNLIQNTALKNLRTAFAIHSKKGFTCPSCKRFLPFSLSKDKNVSCPFLDCSFFGGTESLSLVAHPTTSGRRVFSSFEENMADSSSSSSNFNFISKNEIQQLLDNNYNLIFDVLSGQQKQLKLNNKKETFLFKTAMYQAFLNMLIKQPKDMILYLCCQKKIEDFPIQPQIFQEYISILENSLPFDIYQDNISYTVYDLLDHNLRLFEGISTFRTLLQSQNIINNETTEKYFGKSKEYGSYFLGQLKEVKDLNSNKSLLSLVDKFSFTQIKLKNIANIPINTPIEITHYCLIPHYEMNHMMYLQRLRKKIVNKINVRKK